MKKLVKAVVRPKAPTLSQEDAVDHVRAAGEKGVTARELTKQLLLKDAITATRALSLARRAGLLRSEWTPCADAKTHYALQEARYWVPA